MHIELFKVREGKKKELYCAIPCMWDANTDSLLSSTCIYTYIQYNVYNRGMWSDRTRTLDRKNLV